MKPDPPIVRHPPATTSPTESQGREASRPVAHAAAIPLTGFKGKPLVSLTIVSMFVLISLAGCSSPETSSSSSSSSNPTTASRPATVLARSDGGTNRFDPATITIHTREMVQFQDQSGMHTVTFDDTGGVSPTDSGPMSPGQSFNVTFSEPGTFRYHCQFHMPTMSGTVTVV